MIIVHHFQLWFHAETELWYRHKPHFPGMSVQAALQSDEHSGNVNKKPADPSEEKSCSEVSVIISRTSLYNVINSQNPAGSQDIF